METFFLQAYQRYGEPPCSPEREATRPARLRKREDVVEGRLLVCSAAGNGALSAVPPTACCTTNDSMPHHRRAQALEAAARKARAEDPRTS